MTMDRQIIESFIYKKYIIIIFIIMNLPLSLMLTDIITEEPSTSSNSLMGSQCISLISPVHFRYQRIQVYFLLR